MPNIVFKSGVTLLVLFIGVCATVACLRLLRPREEIGVFLVTPAKLGMYLQEAFVIWTEGDALCSINSSSMSHLLAFEHSSFR